VTVVMLLPCFIGSFSRAVHAAFVGPQQSSALCTSSQLSATNDDKRIVFIRHGCTFMNEYLGKPGCAYGSPNFTDKFPATAEYKDKYQDTKLSPRGHKQASTLSNRLGDLSQKKTNVLSTLGLSIDNANFVQELELVVVSPLTRALQTFQIGLKPHLSENVPIIALPAASERAWLISDIGRPRSQLVKDYPYCDFEMAFDRDGELVEEWWFGLDDRKTKGLAMPSGVTSLTYKEWRPNDQRQEYVCPGEPDEQFDARMIKLYSFLRDRPESTIAVVCHWGVIDWMLGVDFENCELRVVPFGDIQPKTLALSELEQTQGVTG
jgi:broad specificity phosphatase PhoE